MQRIQSPVRNNWKEAVEALGFGFHSTNVPYWDESAYYQFSMDEILKIEAATSRLWEMCLNAVQYVIDEDQYHLFHIPEPFISLIEKSWNQDLPAIYGRFDLAYDGQQIKLLEFNADTPTSLFEAGVVQWYWLQDKDKSKDQFNSIHEKLVAYWAFLEEYLNPGFLHFSCVKRSLEDLTTVEYMRDCAIQAGLDTKLIFIDDIGFDQNAQQFVDMEEEVISNLFKLYPWEWMVHEEFGQKILEAANEPIFIEPAWKMLLSNKAILPILWQLYPNDPLLLEAYFNEPNGLSSYAKKPILSREGANVTLVKNGVTIEQTRGEYGEEGFIYQQFFELPNFEGNHPILGSWVIGQEPAGMGVRESNSLITSNTSRFVPHLIG